MTKLFANCYVRLFSLSVTRTSCFPPPTDVLCSYLISSWFTLPHARAEVYSWFHIDFIWQGELRTSTVMLSPREKRQKFWAIIFNDINIIVLFYGVNHPYTATYYAFTFFGDSSLHPPKEPAEVWPKHKQKVELWRKHPSHTVARVKKAELLR